MSVIVTRNGRVHSPSCPHAKGGDLVLFAPDRAIPCNHCRGQKPFVTEPSDGWVEVADPTYVVVQILKASPSTAGHHGRRALYKAHALGCSGILSVRSDSRKWGLAEIPEGVSECVQCLGTLRPDVLVRQGPLKGREAFGARKVEPALTRSEAVGLLGTVSVSSRKAFLLDTLDECPKCSSSNIQPEPFPSKLWVCWTCDWMGVPTSMQGAS